MINNPFGNPFAAQFTEHWQKLFQQNLSLFAEANAQTVKTALDQFGAGQAQLVQLTSLVTQAWGEMAANTPASADWSAMLDTYTRQLRQQMTALAENVPSPQQMQEFWMRSGQVAQQVSQPWLACWLQAPQWFSQATPSNTPLQAANQALGGAIGQTWNSLLGAPTLGLQRQFQEKVNRWTALTLENQQALREYQLLIGNAWVDAFSALLQKLTALAQAGKSLENPRQLLDLWVEVADGKFLELFHSPAYASAQGKLVNSNMALRQQQRELLEIWLRQNDLPTRSDLDEAHRNIYELRKEVKALKKALSALQPSADPDLPTPTKGRRGHRAKSA